MKINKRTRVISFLLTLVMLVGMLPLSAVPAYAAADKSSAWPTTGSDAVTVSTQSTGLSDKAKANLAAANALKAYLANSTVRYIRLDSDIKCTGDDFAELVQFTVSGEKRLDLNGYTIEIWQNRYAQAYKLNSKDENCDTDRAESLFTVPAGATLTVYDTSAKGSGKINYNSKLAHDYYDSFNGPTRNIFCVENGGTLTVNGGTFDAGRTIKRWMVDATVWLAYGNNSYIHYNGYARQYVAGSPVVALGGSTVTINGGKFISRSDANLGKSAYGIILLGSRYEKVEKENKQLPITVTVNDGEFLANGGDWCFVFSKYKEHENTKIVIRGGSFVCDKNDKTTAYGGSVYLGKYGSIILDNDAGKGIDVASLIDSDSEITKYLDKGDVLVDNFNDRPELVVQPRTGTSDDIVKIKDPGFTVWKPGSKNSQTVGLDTDLYQPLYNDLYRSLAGPANDYNENTSYSVRAEWCFIVDGGAVISNTITTDWDSTVDLSKFKSRGAAFDPLWNATGYKVLTCTVTEKYKSPQHEYTAVNSANWLVYFSSIDYSGTAVTLTAAPGDAQNSASTPVAVTAKITDSLGSEYFRFLFNKRMQFGYVGSDGQPVVTNVLSVGENQDTVSCTLTDLPEGEVTLWAQYSGTWNGDELTFSATQKAFVLPKIAYGYSDSIFYTDDDGYIKFTSATKPAVYLQAIDPAKLPDGCTVTWEIWNGGTGKWEKLSATNAAYEDITIDSHGHLLLADARSGSYRGYVTYGGQTWYSPISLQVVGTDKNVGQKITATADATRIYYEGTTRSACNVTYTRDTATNWGNWWKVYVLVTEDNVPKAAWENLNSSIYFDSFETYGEGKLVEVTGYNYTVKNGTAVTSATTDIGQKLAAKLILRNSNNTVAEGSYKLIPVVKIWTTAGYSGSPAYTITGDPFTVQVGTKANGISMTVDGTEVVSADGFTKQEVSGGYKYTKANGEYTMTNQQTVKLSVKTNGQFPRLQTSCTYVSSDNNILTVDDKGKVTALRPGTAYVTATYTGKIENSSNNGYVTYTYVTSVKITVPIAEMKISEPVWENYMGKYYKDIKLNISQVRSYNGEWVNNTSDKYATSQAVSMMNYATGASMWADFDTLKVAYNDSYTVTFTVKAKDGYQFPLSTLKEYDSSGNPVYYSSSKEYCVDDMSLKTNKLGSDAMNTARANGFTTMTDSDHCYTGEDGRTKSDPAVRVDCAIPCIKDPNATYIKKVSVSTATPKEGDLRCAEMPSDDVIGTANYNQVNMLGAQVTTLMTVKNSVDGGALLGVYGSASKLTKITGSGTPYEPLATTESSANGYLREYYTTLGDSNWLIDKTKLQTAKYEAATYANELTIWSAVTSEDGNSYYFDPDVELYVNGYKVQLITSDGATNGWSTNLLKAAYYYVADPSPAFIEGTVSGITAPVSGVAPDYDSMAVSGTRTDSTVSADSLYVSECVWFIDADGDGIADDDEIAMPITTQVESTDDEGNTVTESQITGYQNLDASGGFLGGKTYSVYIALAAEEGMGRIDDQSFHLKLQVGENAVDLNTSGASGTYTFPETEIVGYDVSGSVVSFLNDTDTVTIQLIEQGHSEVAYETTVTGGTLTGSKYTAAYSFSQVPAGTYTMKVSKANHVTREYTVTVGASAVTQDVQINLLGDINGDGKVNFSDLGKANAHTKKTLTLTGYEFACADVNADGKVNFSDVGKINAHVKQTSLLW